MIGRGAEALVNRFNRKVNGLVLTQQYSSEAREAITKQRTKEIGDLCDKHSLSEHERKIWTGEILDKCTKPPTETEKAESATDHTYHNSESKANSPQPGVSTEPVALDHNYSSQTKGANSGNPGQSLKDIDEEIETTEKIDPFMVVAGAAQGHQEFIETEVVNFDLEDPSIVSTTPNAKDIDGGAKEEVKSKSDESKAYKCQYCSKCVPSRHGILQHIKWKHPDKTLPETWTPSAVEASDLKIFNCQYCKKYSPSITGLKHHTRMMHPDKPMPDFIDRKNEVENSAYKCSHCNKCFQRQSGLMQHVRKAHPEKLDDKKVHQCHHCDKTFYSKSGLTQHERKLHPKVEEVIVEEVNQQGEESKEEECPGDKMLSNQERRLQMIEEIESLPVGQKEQSEAKQYLYETLEMGNHSDQAYQKVQQFIHRMKGQPCSIVGIENAESVLEPSSKAADETPASIVSPNDHSYAVLSAVPVVPAEAASPSQQTAAAATAGPALLSSSPVSLSAGQHIPPSRPAGPENCQELSPSLRDASAPAGSATASTSSSKVSFQQKNVKATSL